MMKYFFNKRVICFIVCFSLMQICFCAQALESTYSNKTLMISQAQKMALSKNAESKKIHNEILLKQMKYEESVVAIKAKVKNIKSFRWSPLLNFKLPQKLKLSEEYDLNVKPQVLQTEIITLKHKLDNLKYTLLNKVNKAYLKVYISNEKANFAQNRLTDAQQKLDSSRILVLTGKVRQDDINTLEKLVDSLTSDLALQNRSFETAKQDLTDLINLDVTEGYTFSNPLKDADLPRSDLKSFTQHALDNDQTCYEVRMSTSIALLNLNSYESLMRSQYGSKIKVINNFITMVKQGEDVDYSAFQIKYKEMLKSMDKPWNGSIKILFFRFTKEWFKGENSGTRYLDSDVYALLTACKEYSSAIAEQKSTEKALKKEISANFESLITARNSYISSQKTLDATSTNLERLTNLNKIGKVQFSEIKDKHNDYETQQLDVIDSLSSYNELLFEFDKLTCGAVSSYMSGQALSVKSSFLPINALDDPCYYIYTDISNMVFVFGITIPEDYEPKVTDYEIWYEGTQIGERTPENEQIRHLALDYQESNKLTLRLYDGESFVTECEIDTTVTKDIIPIQKKSPPKVEKENNAGSYSITTQPIGKVNKSTITLKLNADLAVKYYQISEASGGKIYTEELIPADKEFTYLTLLIASLDTVKLTLYDADKQKIYNALFDEKTQTIIATKS